METIQKQIGAMQEEIKRLREELEVVKKGNFDTITCKRITCREITCRSWKVVDADAKTRISAETARGETSVVWRDKAGKSRIIAATNEHGLAGVDLLDKDGKGRIMATTFFDGGATVQLHDKGGKQRIVAATYADGTVLLPTEDVARPKKP